MIPEVGALWMIGMPLFENGVNTVRDLNLINSVCFNVGFNPIPYLEHWNETLKHKFAIGINQIGEDLNNKKYDVKEARRRIELLIQQIDNQNLDPDYVSPFAYN